jgi:hypothetical protein
MTENKTKRVSVVLLHKIISPSMDLISFADRKLLNLETFNRADIKYHFLLLLLLWLLL